MEYLSNSGLKGTGAVIVLSDGHSGIGTGYGSNIPTRTLYYAISMDVRYDNLYQLLSDSLTNGEPNLRVNTRNFNMYFTKDDRLVSIPTGNVSTPEASTKLGSDDRFLTSSGSYKDKTIYYQRISDDLIVFRYGEFVLFHDTSLQIMVVAHNIFLNNDYTKSLVNKTQFRQNFNTWCSHASMQDGVLRLNNSSPPEVIGSYFEPKCYLQVLVDKNNAIDCNNIENQNLEMCTGNIIDSSEALFAKKPSADEDKNSWIKNSHVFTNTAF